MEYAELLKKFPEVVNPSKVLPEVKHKVVHHIETTGRPVSARYRRLDPGRLAAAKAEFAQMEKEGIVRRSKSEWASPLHMVKKQDGSWRPCGDFRQLNLQSTPDRYTCPNIGDLTARLTGCKVFSKLDLRKGYHQVPVRPEDIKKTAVATPFGLFEFVRMPFGLRNSGQTFQRMMDSILAGLDFCFVYLDDILIASQDHTQHKKDLEAVLSRLQEHGLVLNAEKCELGRTEVKYLGHLISATGIRPLEEKVAAINSFERPVTVRGLQTYLGMVNFYRRFLRGAALVLKPLTDSLQGAAKGRLEWTTEMSQAFISSKKAMLNAVELAHPQEGAELALAVDASTTHVGAVLQQATSDGQTRPLAFFSTKLNAAQTKYSAFDRELLAGYLAVRHFRWLIEGRKFCLITDHKPLVYALHSLSADRPARQLRHLSLIAEYTSDIRHIAGRENLVADALSRPAASVGPQVAPPQPEPSQVKSEGRSAGAASSPSPAGAKTVAVVAPTADGKVNWRKLAQGQKSCVETQELQKSESLEVKKMQLEDQELLCDFSSGAPRPLVPTEQRREVFSRIHGLAHPGIRATQRLISARFVWKGCTKDIAQWCRECQLCGRSKVTVQQRTVVEKIHVPENKFQHIHTDLVGPLPAAKDGTQYLLTVLDRTSRWPEAIPLKGISAVEVADAFTAGWVARFGVPHTVTTDRGTQFTGAVWKSMCSTLGIKHIATTAFHPCSNGMVERFHRQMKESLKARGAGNAWLEHLPWVMLGLRSAPKEDSAVSSAEVLYGTPLVLPGQAQDVAEKRLPKCKLKAIPLRGRSYKAEEDPKDILDRADMVYVRRGMAGGPLKESYAGPYTVLRRAEKVYELKIGDRVETVSTDRLKPFTGKETTPGVPPKRGRPLGTGGGGSPDTRVSPELEGGPVED